MPSSSAGRGARGSGHEAQSAGRGARSDVRSGSARRGSIRTARNVGTTNKHASSHSQRWQQQTKADDDLLDSERYALDSTWTWLGFVRLRQSALQVMRHPLCNCVAQLRIQYTPRDRCSYHIFPNHIHSNEMHDTQGSNVNNALGFTHLFKNSARCC